MGEIKLFKTEKGTAVEQKDQNVYLEKSLQTLVEKNLSTFLGIRFLASEYSTGKTYAGRIDTLGIDENNCPVIIEYKRSLNENVINQGLYYLDWLLDHIGDFKDLVMKKCSKYVADNIEWDGARLICIASDFTKFDGYAINQIDRNIELFRYKVYGSEMLLLERAFAHTLSPKPGKAVHVSDGKKPVEDRLSKSPIEIQDLYEDLKNYLTSLGEDVIHNTLKHYIAFKRYTNFACIDFHNASKQLVIWVNIDPTEVELIPGFTRDVSEIGHYGTGNIEITLSNKSELDAAQMLLSKSYENN